MTTCTKCNCPLMLLNVTKNQKEKRHLCARCFEEASQPKVYRAPKVTKPVAPGPVEEFSIDAFMDGKAPPKKKHEEVTRE